MINETEYTDPFYNGSMDSVLDDVNHIGITLSGRKRKQDAAPDDTSDNAYEKITRRDVIQKAKDIAGNADYANEYLSGHYNLYGNKNRKRLFNRIFNKHYTPSTENLADEVVIGRPTLDPTTLSTEELNNLSPEQQIAVANYWRNPNRLIGQIGGGMEDPIANMHARAYVEPFNKFAIYGIGSAMLGANPITTTALTEGGAALKEALPYADKGVNVLKNWWAKPRSWYNPVQTFKTLINPKAATTAIGEAAASTADLAGVYHAGKANVDLINKWKSGNFHHSDIPQFGLNVVGMLPGIQYFNDFAPAVAQAGKWMIEDTANAAKQLVNGEQPALGVVANPFSRSVNATPSNGFSRVEDGVLQYTMLSPADRARLTHRQGLGPYDIQNLLDRGFSPQQIEQLQDVTTIGLSTNHRANELAQRLMNQGITPALQSRLNYLQDAYNNGVQIVSDSYGRPITQIEAIRRGIRGTRPASMDYVNQYYGKIGGSDLSHPIYNDPSAYRIFEALDEAIGVFDPQTVAKITPDIKRILESGYDSTKSEEEILSDLKTFFESQNKPFYPGPLEQIKASVGNTFTEERDLHRNPHHKWMVGNFEDFIYNPNISLSKYDINNVPTKVVDGQDVYSYNHNYMFKTPRKVLQDWIQQVALRSPHGSVVSEADKSLQSSPIAHTQYADRAKNGEGIITIVQDKFGRPIFDDTNSFAQTTWSPQIDVANGLPKIVSVPSSTLFNTNIRKWSKMIENMHPDAFKLFNGEYPTVNAHIDGNVRTIKFEKNPQTGHVEAVIPDDVHKLLDKIDAREIPAFQQRLDRVLPIMRNEIGDGISFGDGSSLKMINDLPVIQTPDGLVNFDMAGIRGYLFSNPDLFKRLSNIHATWSKVRHPDYHDYYGPFQLNQPRAAFVSFEKGGILSKLNPKHKQFLNIK